MAVVEHLGTRMWGHKMASDHPNGHRTGPPGPTAAAGVCWDGGMPIPFLVPPGEAAALNSRRPASTKGAPGDKAETVAAFAEQHARLGALQAKLFAEKQQSLLVVLQGIDTSGKDGAIRHMFRGLDPSGARVAAFGVPSSLELAHDFLWRVHKQAPRTGEIVIFNRSHYEDVLVVRVHHLVPARVWRARYEHINAFERLLSARRTRIVKFLLQISPHEQAKRLQARLDRPDKRWKLQASDLADQQRWDEYEAAFTEMVERTSTEEAPWYIIPADHKWFRNWAVSEVLIRVLTEMDPKYPLAEPPPRTGTLGP
jgi:PPK2 family polyphosphate:nucleotide phosphotransferase